MTPDIDIWRCAAVMIKRYGDTADIEASRRAPLGESYRREYQKRFPGKLK